MNVQITVVLSGEGADRRTAVRMEDAISEALGALRTDDVEFPEVEVSYPSHRNGSIGFVFTAGQMPERKPRVVTPETPLTNMEAERFGD